MFDDPSPSVPSSSSEPGPASGCASGGASLDASRPSRSPDGPDGPPSPRRPMNGTRSKNKGSSFERELAAYLNDALYPTSSPPRIHRTPLSGSFSPIRGVGSADLTGTPFLWVEAKRTERLKPHEFLAQATSSAAALSCPDIPVVITRRSRQSLPSSLVFLSLSDFLTLYRSHLTLHNKL